MTLLVALMGLRGVVAQVGGLAGQLEPFFLGYGVLGAMFVAVLLGWLRPKWHSDEAAKREAAKDEIIAGLTDALQRLADTKEAKR